MNKELLENYKKQNPVKFALKFGNIMEETIKPEEVVAPVEPTEEKPVETTSESVEATILEEKVEEKTNE